MFDGEIFVGEFLPFVRRPDDVEVFVELLVDGRTPTILESLHAGILTVAIHPVIAGLDHVFKEELEELGKEFQRELQRNVMENENKMGLRSRKSKGGKESWGWMIDGI